MEFLTLLLPWLVWLVLGTLVVFGGVGLALEISLRRQIRAMTTEQLRRVVFGGDGTSRRHYDSYLDYVGRDRESVRTFVRLIEAQDLRALYRQWPELEKDFLRGERLAGRRGRPFIMDCMFEYRSFVRELLRRGD